MVAIGSGRGRAIAERWGVLRWALLWGGHIGWLWGVREEDGRGEEGGAGGGVE